MRAAWTRRTSAVPGIDDLRAAGGCGAPVVALVFYRSHLLSGNTAAFDALGRRALHAEGLNPLPARRSIRSRTRCACPRCANSCSHARGAAGAQHHGLRSAGRARRQGAGGELALAGDAPVLQVIVSGGNREDWLADSQGLRPRDIAMQIALPEMDGRIVARAVSFKGPVASLQLTQTEVVGYRAEPDRIAFVAELRAPLVPRCAACRRPTSGLALVLANYPRSEGRIGSGVGLDTPASVIAILERCAPKAMRSAIGRRCRPTATPLMQTLQEGIANDPREWPARPPWQS